MSTDDLLANDLARVSDALELLMRKAATLDRIIEALNDDDNEYDYERLSAVEGILLNDGFSINY